MGVRVKVFTPVREGDPFSIKFIFNELECPAFASDQQGTTDPAKPPPLRASKPGVKSPPDCQSGLRSPDS